MPNFVKQGLTGLTVRGIDQDSVDTWPCELLAQSSSTLRFLHLGNDVHLAQDYAIGSLQKEYAVSTWVSNAIKDNLPMEDQVAAPLASLTVLSLSGFDFHDVVVGTDWLAVDFRNLTTLQLHSCSGLKEGFELLTSDNAAKEASQALGALKRFLLRSEFVTKQFRDQLEAFLTSFTGLTDPEVSLEGVRSLHDLDPILKAHGPTLTVLLWEERTELRRCASYVTPLSQSRQLKSFQ